MTIYESFAVVDVPFPFIDSSLGKKEAGPCPFKSIVPEKHNDALVLAMITSAERGAWAYDVALADWREAGLAKILRAPMEALYFGFRAHRGIARQAF